jgi:anaerobic magnesium-protoporphyrin IX monomethyl ester cyclase
VRILVVVPRFVPTPGDYYSFPLGMAYITSALKEAGHQVFGLNLNHRIGDSAQLVATAVRVHSAEVCTTGSLSPFLPEVKRIFTAARSANPHIINIAGGGVVSSDPEVAPPIMDIDYGVVGEGEVTICELLEAIQRGTDPALCEGIVFRNKKGEIVQTGDRGPIMDLTKFAWPDYETLGFSEALHLRRPLDHHFFQAQDNNAPRSVDMITSRSCPYSCTFCFHPVGKVYRERPLDEFFAELNTLIAKYQVNMVGVLDELFSLRRARLLEFCERIKPLNLNWLVQLHPHSADKEILNAMHDAGCSYISYGVESMSQSVLISMQKKSKKERIERTLDDTFEAKVGIQGNLIFGDTAETLETANESMSWWAHNRKYQVNLSRLQVYPGSPDYIVAVRDGMIPDRVAYANDLPIYLNISNMNNDNLDALSFQADIQHRTLLNVAPVQSFTVSKEQIEGRGTAYDIIWTCPRCEHINHYDQCVMRPDHGKSLRVFCRSCRSRWDVRNFAAYGEVGPTSANKAGGIGVKARGLARKFLRSRAGAPARAAIHAILGRPRPLGPQAMTKERGKVEEFRQAGLAVDADPFAAARHVRFADALAAVGALGAARLHYEQALRLEPRSAQFAASLAALKARPDYAAKAETYFVSFSDAPPPYRKSREVACYDRKREPAFPVYSRAANRESVHAAAK